MLVNKNKSKTSKKKTKKDTSSQDNVQSMRSWIRKIEQSTNSVSSRLSAVEKRISRKSVDSSNDSIQSNLLEGPIERIFADLKEGKSSKDIEEVSRILDSEFTIMQEELISQENEITSLEGQLSTISSSLAEIKEEMEKLQTSETQMSHYVNVRLEKIERREPPVMRIGSMEIPIEFTGVIGGILVFIIAILVIVGQKEIIISPTFLAIVGILLIGSALFKTVNLGARVGRVYEKISKLEEHS